MAFLGIFMRKVRQGKANSLELTSLNYSSRLWGIETVEYLALGTRVI